MILLLLILIPIIAAILSIFIKPRFISITFSLINVLVALTTIFNYPFFEEYKISDILNVNLILGIDKINVSLVILTTILFFIVFILPYEYNKLYFILFNICYSSIIGTFISFNLIFFYIFWDIVLICMFFIILFYGSERRKFASIKFLIYTGFSSFLILIAMILIYNNYNDFDLRNLQVKEFLTLPFFLLLIAFSIKMAIFPFHNWLPEAHVEAPTGGSIILAGLLLKMGSYGLLRLNYLLMNETFSFFSSQIFLFSLISIFYSSIVTIFQRDFKRIIAFSSIIHMSLILIGISSNSIIGSLFEMFNHGLIASLGFIISGYMLKIFNSRDIEIVKYKLNSTIGTSTLILFVSLISLPFTSSFPPKFLILKGSFETFGNLSFIAIFSIMIFSTGILYILHKILYYREKHKDLNLREFLPIILNSILIFSFGIYPNLLIGLIK